MNRKGQKDTTLRITLRYLGAHATNAHVVQNSECIIEATCAHK